MGYIFEELLRRFSELSNETAGEHFTPREVIRLIVNLLFGEDSDVLTGTAPVRSIYDPACGTGGMLNIADQYLTRLNPKARLEMFGQELNPETWAIARSDLLIQGQDPERIVLGNTLTADGHADKRFDYLLANPPFGVDWNKSAKEITRRGRAARRPVQRRPSPRLRRVAAVPAADDRPDEAGRGRRQPRRDRLLRQPAVRRRR